MSKCGAKTEVYSRVGVYRSVYGGVNHEQVRRKVRSAKERRFEMSEPKFFTGPWRIIWHGPKCDFMSRIGFGVLTPNGLFIVDPCGCMTDETASANAALISTSPNMYDDLFRSDDLLRDALKRINPDSGLGRCIQEQLKRNEKTMKKARGEE